MFRQQPLTEFLLFYELTQKITLLALFSAQRCQSRDTYVRPLVYANTDDCTAFTYGVIFKQSRKGHVTMSIVRLPII